MGGEELKYPRDGTTLDKTKWYLGLGGEPDPTPVSVIFAIIIPATVGCVLVADWLINDHWLTNLGALFVGGAISSPLLRRAEDRYAASPP